tara:strand:+ start:1245 stop:1739 length:495 start_codon:yes stop_codon:yes gene_type:complete
MVYKKGVLFLFLFCFYTPKTTSHAFYVSVCNVYMKNEKLVFSFRVFKDDVFDALNIVGESSNTTEKEKLKISEYIVKNFKVKVNEETIKLSIEKLVFEGSDYTESVNLILSTNLVGDIKNFYIKNTILFDHIDEQMNVVGITTKDFKTTTTYKKNLSERWIKTQ